MKRWPYENYIRFLITCGFDLEKTLQKIKELELPPCPREYWDKQFEIVDSVKLPKKIKKYWSNPKGNRPATFVKSMGALGLTDMWKHHIGEATRMSMTLDIVSDPDVRLVCNALLLRRADKEEICAVLQAKFGMSVRTESISMYENYFFQVRIMSRTSWRHYLDAMEGPEKKIVYFALSGKEMEMRAELGLPNKISVSEHYQQLHIQALEKFKTLLNSNLPSADATALKWAQLAMSAGDKYEKLKLGDSADFGKDLQMEFEYIDTDFPGIGEDDMDQISANVDIGEAKDQHEPIPLEKNPIKEL